MRDIYACVIFLRVKIYWMFFYWSHFFDVHFSYCEVFMCQVFPDTIYLPKTLCNLGLYGLTESISNPEMFQYSLSWILITKLFNRKGTTQEGHWNNGSINNRLFSGVIEKNTILPNIMLSLRSIKHIHKNITKATIQKYKFTPW